MGGVSYGFATGAIDGREIRNGTITTKDVRNNEVRGADIRNSTIGGRDVAFNTLGGNDIKESTLAKVPDADTVTASTRRQRVRCARRRRRFSPLTLSAGAAAVPARPRPASTSMRCGYVHLRGALSRPAHGPLHACPRCTPGGTSRFAVRGTTMHSDVLTIEPNGEATVAGAGGDGLAGRRHASRAGALDLDHHRQHHRPALHAPVDELGQVVVQVGLEGADLADALLGRSLQRVHDRVAQVVQQRLGILL